MTDTHLTLDEGTLAYDIGQTPHTPVIVTDPDVGTIEEQPDAQEEIIRRNMTNQAIGFDDDTQCVEVTFFDLSSKNRDTYTYPVTRIGIPRVDIGDHALSTKQYLQFLALRDLLAEAVRTDDEMESVDLVATLRYLWKDAGLDDAVLDAAGTDTDAFTDDS